MEYTELNVQKFIDKCPQGRLLGVDLGTKTIGIAVSDDNRRVASPLLTIVRKKFSQDAQKIIEVINNQTTKGIVIGWPVNMDGSESKKCQATHNFVTEFKKINDTNFLYWDERLTTVEAERAMINADMSRKKRKKYVNHVAAAIILQSALERINNINT